MEESTLPIVVQFYDNRQEIKQMLDRRFPIRSIWKTLHEKGTYSGDYTHFCRLAKKEFPEKQSSIVKKQMSKAPEEQENGPLMYMGDLTKSKN